MPAGLDIKNYPEIWINRDKKYTNPCTYFDLPAHFLVFAFMETGYGFWFIFFLGHIVQAADQTGVCRTYKKCICVPERWHVGLASSESINYL